MADVQVIRLPASWIGEPIALVGGRIVAAVDATVPAVTGTVRLRSSLDRMIEAQRRALQYTSQNHECETTG